jgi:hypothetical protein
MSIPIIEIKPQWAVEESEMPALSRFYGIVIKMYYNEHGVPHFHAIYAEDAASIRIDTLEFLGGYLPPVARKLVMQWGVVNRDALLKNWKLSQDGQPLDVIPGLE